MSRKTNRTPSPGMMHLTRMSAAVMSAADDVERRHERERKKAMKRIRKAHRARWQ